MYVHGFRFFFTPLAGVLFAFPSRYWFAIGHWLGIQPWGVVPPPSRGISRAPRYSGSASAGILAGTGPSPSPAARSSAFPFGCFAFSAPHTPAFAGLGSSVFARRYSRNRFLFLFLPVLGCFGSRGCPLWRASAPCWPALPGRVPPFGNPRIEALMRLPAAYRGITRPSSPASAKASAARPVTTSGLMHLNGSAPRHRPGTRQLRLAPAFAAGASLQNNRLFS